MVKILPVLALMAIFFVGLVVGEITVTFEPYNETKHEPLYGQSSESIHNTNGTQAQDEEEVETFYVRSGVSDGDENPGDIPATQTHSPIKETQERRTDVSISDTPLWSQPEPPKQCPNCCQQPNCQVKRPVGVKYPNHPLFPTWSGSGSHAPVIEDDAEYINGGAGGGQQVIFINRPQPPDSHPQPPIFSPLLPEYPVQQQPQHPSIVYIPYSPSASGGPPQIPWHGEGAGGGVDTGFNVGGGEFEGGLDVSSAGFGGGFNEGSAHRNHEQLWRLHQQQHQQWLQRQRQQQQNQFSHLVVGGGGNGYATIGNFGTIGGVVNGGGQRRPCDSRK